MDTEAVNFFRSGTIPAVWKCLGRAVVYLPTGLQISPTTVNACKLQLISTITVIMFQNQNHECLKTKAIMLKLIKSTEQTLLCKKAVN